MSTILDFSEGFLMSSDMQPKRTIADKVWARAKTGKCLHCDLPAYRRGICFHHYHQYRTNLHGLPVKKRNLFQAESVREGKILPTRQGKRVSAVDVFSEVSERVGA